MSNLAKVSELTGGFEVCRLSKNLTLSHSTTLVLASLMKGKRGLIFLTLLAREVASSEANVFLRTQGKEQPICRELNVAS